MESRAMGVARVVRWAARSATKRRAAALAVAAVTVATSSTSTAPARQAIPAPLHHVYRDDFTGPLNSHWRLYGGQPGGDPAGWWSPSHVSVQSGSLVLRGELDKGRYTTGGVMLYHGLPALKYGKVQVRYRVDAGPYAFVFLLWPSSGSWPPEIDFAEDNGGDRKLLSAFQHYRDSTGKHRQFTNTLAVDSTKWHTAGVEWEPGVIRYTMDGSVWAVQTNGYVPSQGMNLAMQQQAWPCNHGWYKVCPNSTTPPVKVYVDWVDVWSR